MLKLSNLKKTFNPYTASEHIALDGLNLNLNEGEFATIIGSNGAGKSTLFGAISGSFDVDFGEIVLGNQNITFLKEHKRSKIIGRVFQDPMKGTAPTMTVEENLALAYSRTNKGVFGRAITKRDADFFKTELESFEMNLENKTKTKVSSLSGGQRQALSLLMTTIAKPKLLLLDEHTAALDPKSAEKIIEMTCKIQKRDNITTLMITHNINQALTTGTRTLMLDAGKFILDLPNDTRKNMTLKDLMSLYENKKDFASDRMLFNK